LWGGGILLSRLAVLLLVALLATTALSVAAPSAGATLRYCTGDVDALCYSQAYQRFCLVIVGDHCIDPSPIGPGL
jgi:hypothetical protein